MLVSFHKVSLRINIIAYVFLHIASENQTELYIGTENQTEIRIRTELNRVKYLVIPTRLKVPRYATVGKYAMKTSNDS